VKVVFALHNFAYDDAGLFREVNALCVPSEFARTAYRERIGVNAEVVQFPRRLGNVLADRIDRRFATFVNPIPVKGVTYFARIAAELSARRPDIPFLVVEGRGGADWLRRLPIDLSGVRNLHLMRSTPRPSEFYARSRVVLMPSLWEESFGRVAAEALANGIPVLASRRGALPETLGDAGILFDIPERYVSEMMEVPSAGDVAEWIETIERLWDDAEFYEEHRKKALERARVWQLDRIRPEVEEFFRRVARRK
jgi:glycosyltransferase involved in cell wall biosynthesis